MARISVTKSQAARRSWQERAELWRDKINTAKLINRLEEFVHSFISPKGYVLIQEKLSASQLDAIGITGEQFQQIKELSSRVIGIEMTPSQVKASQVLLDRVMPTLSASEITRKTEPVSPKELIDQMRARYGDEFADMLAKDFQPEQPEATHEAPETEQ